MADSQCKQPYEKNFLCGYPGPHSNSRGRRHQAVTHVWLKDDVMKFLFVIFLCSWSVPVVAGGPGYSYGYTDENGTLVMNVTEAPKLCPPQRDCDEGSIVGPVIGSLLAGLIIGAAAMYLAMRYLHSKKKTLPPKDYDVTETSLFDVNRNSSNDPAPYITPVDAEDYSEKPDVKGHKKLERLVKPTQRAPVDIEIPSAATPLIHKVESPGEDNPGATATPVGGTKTTGDVNGADPLPSFYSNTGQDSAVSQPYESLDIIPEEVEYENAKLNSYEDFSRFSAEPKAS